MSLILDALNRSRQDSEQMPGLASVHPVAGAATTGVSGFQWLLVLALALAVLAIGWLLFDRSPQPAPAVHVPAVATAPELPEQGSTSSPLPSPAAEPDVARPQTTIRPASPPATAPAVPQSLAITTPPVEPAPAPVDPGVAALYQQREQAVSAPPEPSRRPAQRAQPQEQAAGLEEELIDIEQLVETAESELAEARLSEHEVPFLSALSQQTKDSIPTLMYLQHDYSGDPARSSVVINGKTLRVGGSVGGVKVEEILPDSVVLQLKGSRFRLRALNSWVNL